MLAHVTYVPDRLFAIGWVFLADNRSIWAWLGLASAGLAALTVIYTAMIYASLRMIHQWCNGCVVPNYLVLTLMTGALFLGVLAQTLDLISAWISRLALATIALAVLLKLSNWCFVDTNPAVSTAQSATGLGALGSVRMLDPPHTQENYLRREMGFRIARKHAAALRASVVLLGFAMPATLVLLAQLVIHPAVGTMASVLAALSASTGVVIERWLFFAEAKHVVALYYGAREV